MFNTQDSPPINGENKKIRSFRKGALHRLRVKLNLQSKITLIKFASGDYARKYLVDEPLLARRGQYGYDPNVEREVNAALTHGRPLSEAGKIKLGKERGKTVFTKLGIHFKKTKEGERIAEPGQRVTPYQSLKSGISRQQKDLTAIPKPTPPEELPPPEILSHHNTKLPNRGMSYEGHDVPDLWNREEAGKASNVIHTYPGREKRKSFTPEEVSIKAREYRDPVASHKARVKAGLTPNLIVKREDKIAHLPSEYLPKAVDVEERRQAQAIRDNLAGKLKAIHKETIQPMRRLHPGIDLSPAVLNRAHKTLRSKIGEVTEGHVQAAEKIKQSVNDRILKRLAGDQKREGRGLRGDALSGHLTKYNAIKDSSNRLTNEVFNQRRTSIEGDLARVPKGLRGQPGLEDWEVKAIADHAGVTPDRIKKLHKSFVNHTRLGTTQGGEDQIRKSLTKKVLSGIPVTPEKTIKHTYPAFKTLGKVGAIGAGLLGAGYAAKRIFGKKKEFSADKPLKGRTIKLIGKNRLALSGVCNNGIILADVSRWRPVINFKRDDKPRPSILAHAATGGVEGAAGIYAVDPLLEKFKHGGKMVNPFKDSALGHTKKIAIGGIVGALATAPIGALVERYRLKRKLRENSDQLRLSAMNKIMNFESQRTIVGKDRYVKQIKEKDLSSARHNYAGSAIAGAAVATLLRKKASLGNAVLTGASVGLATQGATRIGTAFTKDQFGERSWKSKRVDRAPWVAGGIAAAGLGLRKYAKGLHKFEIKFQQFIPAEGNGTSWHQREVTRWLKHPKSRVENAQKWLSRAERINKDVGLTRTSGGKVIDDRGRERKAELSKDWVKRAIGGGVAVGVLTGGALLKRRIGRSAVDAAGLLEKGVHPSQLSQGERMSLNITSGNLGRAIRGKLKSMFPKFSGGMKKLGGLSEDVNQAKEAILRKGNKAIESQTGHITRASFRRNKQNEITGINIENPAEAKENLEKLQVQHDKVQRRLTQIRRQQDRVKETQGTRGKVEKIIKPPKDKMFISKSKAIQFQDEVYVRPHSRSPRRNKYTHEKKDFREGLLIGGGLGLGGLGVGSGMAYKASRQKFTEETEARIMKRLQEISAKNVASKAVKSGFKLLSSRLDDLIRLT